MVPARAQSRETLSWGTSLHGISGADGYATAHLNLSSFHVPCSQLYSIWLLVDGHTPHWIGFSILKMVHIHNVLLVSRSYSPIGNPHINPNKIRGTAKWFLCMGFTRRGSQVSNMKHYDRHPSGNRKNPNSNVPQTVCPYWRVLTVGVKAGAWSSCSRVSRSWPAAFYL